MNGFGFAPPLGPAPTLGLAVALAAALALGAWATRRAERRMRATFGRRAAAVLGRPVHRRTRAGLAALAAACAGLAALGPVAVGDGEPLGPDLVYCVDVSRSMAAADAPPSRFGAALAQLAACQQQALGARTGLVAYAGDARLVVPLTADRDALVWLARELQPGTLGRGGSDPGRAIEVAANALARAGGGGDIVLLSDGEDFVGRGTAAAAAAFAAGHRVHCVGFGEEGGSKIVVGERGDGTFLRDANGDDVITRLAIDELQATAGAGGGRCVRAGGDGLPALYRADLQPHAASARLARGEVAMVQHFQWPLLAALLLWMLRACLPERRR